MKRTLKNRAEGPTSVTFYARKSQRIRSSSHASAFSLYLTKKERVKSISILEWKKKNLEIQRDSVREIVKKIELNRKEGV